MGSTTGIAWTNSTWNPWRGCTRVSPGCKFCYMFREQKRYGRDPSVVTRCKDSTFNKPLTWQKKAAQSGEKQLVFTCSWSDWFHPMADAWRDEAWQIVKNCPNLTFQILTKRPENISTRLPADWGQGYPNFWLGVSIENNDYVKRADILRQTPAQIRFISAEPLLGPLDQLSLNGIDWLILGGESAGPGEDVRECDGSWMLDLLNRKPADLSVFVKQLGQKFRWNNETYSVGKKKRDKMKDFPQELQVQEYPAA